VIPDPNESDDRALLEQARQRAGRLLDGVTSDVESLRGAGSESAYADGAALCEQLADAARELIAHLDSELPPNPAPESPHQ
jgi:hypothetical protein